MDYTLNCANELDLSDYNSLEELEEIGSLRDCSCELFDFSDDLDDLLQ